MPPDTFYLPLSTINIIRYRFSPNKAETYKSLSKRFGPSPITICRKSKKGKWPQLRKEYSREKQIKTHKNLLDKESRQKADLITKMNKAHYDSQQGLKFLADKTVIDDVNRVKEGKSGQLSARQIQSLTNANFSRVFAVRSCKRSTEWPTNLSPRGSMGRGRLRTSQGTLNVPSWSVVQGSTMN